MAIRAFDRALADGQWSKPSIQVLEVRDRSRPKDPPIARLLVEREETKALYPDGTLRSASIELRYELLSSDIARHLDKGSFCGGWRRGPGDTDEVSITAPNCVGGFVTLDLQGLEGHRIGSYLMNEVVAWVKQWPNAMVNAVHLLAGQSHGENKERRNRFYERFGLVFDYEDPATRVAGISRPMRAADLTPVETWCENIAELGMREFMGDLIRQNESLQFELRLSRQDQRQESERMEAARRHPIFWALCQLWDKAMFRLRL